MWGLLGPLLGIGAGIGIHELFIKSEPLSEVVQFTTSEKLIQMNSAGLTAANIKHEVNTDGSNSWIMVKPSDRTRAVGIVRQAIGK